MLHSAASLDRPFSPKAAAVVEQLKEVKPGPEMHRVLNGVVSELRSSYEAQLGSTRPVFFLRLVPVVGKLAAAHLTSTRKHHAALQAALEGAYAAKAYLEANYADAAKDVVATKGKDLAAKARYGAWERQVDVLRKPLSACEAVNKPMESAPLAEVWVEAFDIRKCPSQSRWLPWSG